MTRLAIPVKTAGAPYRLLTGAAQKAHGIILTKKQKRTSLVSDKIVL